jgi:hypothetical protein
MVNAKAAELLPPEVEVEGTDDVAVETGHGDDQGAGETDEEGDGDGDDDGVFYYAVTLHNGLRSFHEDDRDPVELATHFKASVMFPARPDSLFTDEELEYFEALQKEDPKRYGEKTARAFVFQIGDAIMDPRQVSELCPADDLMYKTEEQREAEEAAAAESEGKDATVTVMPQLAPMPALPPEPPAAPAILPPSKNGRLSRLGKK